MKIAFVGDSFCMNYNRGSTDWPAMVADTIGAEIIQTGFGGQTFYTALELFLSDNFHQADYVVLCPTEPYRVYNNYNLPLNNTWVDQLTNKKGNHWNLIENGTYEKKYKIPNSVLVNEILPGAKAYYDHFMTDQCAETMNIGLVMWLDNLLKKHNKKVIWLPSFCQSTQYPSFYYNHPDLNKSNQKYYTPISGPSSNIPLFDISYTELVHDNLSEKDIGNVVSNDGRPNHFNTENNGILARIVLDIIEKDDFSPKAINMEEYFSHLDLSKVTRIR